jgi:uncharacterized membrane protein YheB (UPF0754 family)
MSAVLLGGFIGGFTNTIAIRMMFERYWYLPGSGVLLKKRDDIIQSLAGTVETHIINPELLHDKLRTAVEKVDACEIRNAVNAAIDEFRDDVLELVNSDKAHGHVIERLESMSGFWGKILNGTGIIHFDSLAHKILDHLDKQVSTFRLTDSMLEGVMERTGSLEQFVFQPNNPVLIKHYQTEDSLATMLLSRLNVKEIVIDKLSAYPAEQVRDIVQEGIREHLAWLEVFGVILGIAFSAIFIGLSKAAALWG